MALTFDPFREMDRLTSQLLGGQPGQRAPRWMPMDLYRKGDTFVVQIDLPGVDPSTIDLNVDGNTLTVQAERPAAAEQDAKWIAQERAVGAYMRQLNLGDGLDVERIEAAYENGVLVLTIPVAEQAKPRKIEVQQRSSVQQIGQHEREQGTQAA